MNGQQNVKNANVFFHANFSLYGISYSIKICFLTIDIVLFMAFSDLIIMTDSYRAASVAVTMSTKWRKLFASGY